MSRGIAAGLLAGVMLASTARAELAATPHAAAKDARGPGVANARTSAAAKVRASAAAKAKASGSNMPGGFRWPPSRLMLDAAAGCERALDAAGIAWHHAPREGRIVDAVTIDDGSLGGIAYTPVFGGGPHKLDCQLALALVTIGPALAAAGVREVRFGSIYRWSNVRVGGKTKNALSRHALGLAMDVVSFVDTGGREARIARDYRLGDPLLLAVERLVDASRSFRLLLTPNNDPISHKDHFHLEANPSYAASPPRS